MAVYSHNYLEDLNKKLFLKHNKLLPILEINYKTYQHLFNKLLKTKLIPNIWKDFLVNKRKQLNLYKVILINLVEATTLLLLKV